MKKAFTLAEALVTLVVLGVIAAVTVPTIKGSFSSDKYLFKAAFNTFSTVIDELINDTSLYPVLDTAPDPDVQYTGLSHGGDISYFCTNFTAKINTISEDCTSTEDPTSTTVAPNAITTNGMRWWGLRDTIEDATETIYVDIDGVNKGANTVGSDILRIKLAPSGKISLDTTPETTYMQD